MFLSLQGLCWPFTTIVQFLQHGSPSLSKPLYFFHSSNLESFSFLTGFSFLIAFFRPDLEADLEAGDRSFAPVPSPSERFFLPPPPDWPPPNLKLTDKALLTVSSLVMRWPAAIRFMV